MQAGPETLSLTSCVLRLHPQTRKPQTLNRDPYAKQQLSSLPPIPTPRSTHTLNPSTLHLLPPLPCQASLGLSCADSDVPGFPDHINRNLLAPAPPRVHKVNLGGFLACWL